MRYAIVTEGITYPCVRMIEETDMAEIDAMILKMNNEQISSPPALLIDFEERKALRILIDGGKTVELSDTADIMYGLNTPIEEIGMPAPTLTSTLPAVE